MSAEQFETIIFSAIGFLLIVGGLAGALYGTINTYVTSTDPNYAAVPLETRLSILVEFLRTLLGFSLILKTRGWVAPIRKVRTAGS